MMPTMYPFGLLAQIVEADCQDKARKKFSILCPKFAMDYMGLMGCLDVADHKMILQNCSHV
jgi:hypothetical protein